MTVVHFPHSANPTFATRTPLHIGAVGLAVRDLDQAVAFYRDMLGLAVLERVDGEVRLGVADIVLIELAHRPGLRPDDTHTAGLYHLAFVMPTRSDLARWLLTLARAGGPIIGGNDHGVCEAFYLQDPEGNGVEIYADRPPETWQWSEGQVLMPTVPLDTEDLLRAADEMEYAAAPAGLRVGHVHLRVGDLDAAEEFYHGAIGLEPTRRRAGAAFLSSGHYHHHIAINVWDSRGAGPRDQQRAGLSWFSIAVSDAATRDAIGLRLRQAGAPVAASPGGLETADPWGTRVRLVAA
jgi:catechol 2,3-dioxygenase